MSIDQNNSKYSGIEVSLRNNQKKTINPVGISEYFRFASLKDFIIITIGVIFSIGLGAISPFNYLLWGEMVDSLSKKQEILDTTQNLLKFYSLIALSLLFCSWISNTCWLITAKRQSILCRIKYFTSIMNQEIGWFDFSQKNSLKSELMKELLVFEEGMIGTFSNIVFLISLGVSNLIFSFIKGWLMSLVVLSLVPLLIFSMFMTLKMNLLKQQNEQKAYSKAATVAEEAFSLIKTVKSLKGEKYQCKKYNDCLNKNGNKKFSILFGLSFGGIYTSLIFIFTLGFWFGANCIYQTKHCPASISNTNYSAGILISILYSILTLGILISRLPIAFRKLVQGRRAAAKIFKIIDRQPKIKCPENGKIIENFKGEIQFHNVSFSYPKEPSKKILNGLNLKIDKLNNALVGHSGCGKSTILQLLLRFYDPDEGEITVDGTNLKELDLVWWRNTIGYVGQQPVLFKGSIKENLSLTNENVSEEEIIEALKKAEVWDFVSQLQNTINTQVGEGGTQISGGQKQRIAIARALIKKPKILFLDEATSALDIRTERKIQKTLNKISKDILSITVAHRLDTIKNADEIFSISQGKVVEKGTFEELEIFKNIKQASKQNIQNYDEKMASAVNDSEILKENKEIEQEPAQEQKNKQSLTAIEDKFSFRRLLPYIEGSKLLFSFGIFITAVFGSIYPAFITLFSNILVILMEGQQIIDMINQKIFVMISIGFLALIVGALQTIIFEHIGTKISMKIRSETFEKILKLPIPWYQSKNNSVGQISSKLGVGCYHMKQFTTVYIYGIFQNIFTLISSIVISIVYEWRTGLTYVGILPITIGAIVLKVYFNNSLSRESENSSKQPIFNPNEALSNIRTVKSLGCEKSFSKIYKQTLMITRSQSIKPQMIKGFFFGLTEFLTCFTSALVLYIGSIFLVKYNADLLSVVTAIFVLYLGGTSIGNNSQILPDVTKCKISISQLFLILDTEDQQINQISSKSLMIKDKKISQGITFKDICFNHRQRKQLFQNFNLQIPFGKKIGFAGDSGCGKSTLFSLLLRFYEPTSGEILLDGINIKDFDIHYLRSIFGIVFQEPNLFNTTIIQNVKYNLQNVDEQKIYQSLSIAEAMNFIKEKQSPNNLQPMESSVRLITTEMNLPTKQEKLAKGLDRNVGPKGSHISGGQKQRLAIARTILRQPTVLLMDEATSNLDGANEEKVQRNLDSFVKDKLFIVIAHRLETIKNSDTIFVFKEGKVIQSGQYENLNQQNGYFERLLKGS